MAEGQEGSNVSYVVCAKWIAREASVEEVSSALVELAGSSRDEPGNLEYRIHRDLEDRRVFFLYEHYVDAASYQAHLSSEHFALAREQAFHLLESRVRDFYGTWDV